MAGRSGSNSLTKGPLPPGVYWRRRVIALVCAAMLVFVIARLLGGGSDGKSDESARQAAAETTTTAPATTSASDAATETDTSATGATDGVTDGASDPTAGSSSPITLADPTGKCTPSDIEVTPQVDTAVAGSDITVKLALQTRTEAACTWQVTAHDLALKIVRHGRVLWTTQQCGSALPERSVVVRSVVPSIVSMVWNGRTSVDGCKGGTAWVRPGPLAVWASTLGGEPGHTTVQMVLASAQSSSSASSSGTSSPSSSALTPKANPTDHVGATSGGEPVR